MTENNLIVFIKNPVLGLAKKRLAETVGTEKAHQIYLELLKHTKEVALAVEARRFLFYSDFIDENDGWDEQHFIKRTQSGNDLGERMAHTFEEALKDDGKAVLVGGDIPKLSKEIIEDAFEKLDDHDFVIGPATDGGYYLIGMKSPQPAVFQDIPWSSTLTLYLTKKKMEALGKSCYHLAMLSDVDVEADWVNQGWGL